MFEIKRRQLRVLFASGAFAMALGGLMPASTFTGAAWAQEDGGGHEDGAGHEDGGGKGGSHGHGGHHGKPVPPEDTIVLETGAEATAVSDRRKKQGSGNYLRLELGAASASAGDASWLPPGYPRDPQVFFDLDVDSSAMVAFGIGQDYGNGWRSEVSLNLFGETDFEGPWSYTVPADPGPHADMEGSVRSAALMVNGYRDFDSGGALVPFVTIGIGIANNRMSNWTRINPDAFRPRRSFEGGSDTGLAWSVGAGLAWEVGPVLGSAPAKVELTWRYFDLGSVSGGSTALDGSGDDNPVRGLNFDVTDHVISLGLRIPI